MPLTLYSLPEARDLMELETGYTYDIEAVRKAAKTKTLVCFWVGMEPIFTKENIIDYLWEHARHKPQSSPPTVNAKE